MTNKKKKRDTSFSKTGKLIDRNGLDKIRAVWEKNGIYQTAEILGTSPGVIRYIAHRESGTRKAEKVPHLVKAVQSGRVKATYYKTLDFSDVQTNFNSKTGENNEK